MRYVAAYLLAVLGSNTNPKSSDLEKILGSVGIEADKEKLSIVMKQLEGKNIDELLKEGLGKLASMPAGGGGAVAAAASGDAAPAEKKEDKKEAKKEESEEEDDDMGFGLFD